MPPDPDSVILELKGVSKHFDGPRGRTPVLEAIDLVVRRGETIVIAGRSGAGKSTLLSLLAGLDRPSAGTILLEGSPLETRSNRDLAALRRKKIGIIFQSFNLIQSWTAQENVEAALIPAGAPRAARRKKAAAVLSSLGLHDRLDHLPSELSIGEAQRVAVARTMVNEPALVLADEPTGEVDSQTAREILDLLTGPVAAAGATLLIATHGSLPPLPGARMLRLAEGKLKA